MCDIAKSGSSLFSVGKEGGTEGNMELTYPLGSLWRKRALTGLPPIKWIGGAQRVGG
jgi:hypothetical protein